MVIGDKVQHFSTGSIGTVIDTVYSMGSDLQRFVGNASVALSSFNPCV